MPTASPTHSSFAGQRPHSPAMIRAQIGIEAMATAATPDETHCSATTTQALPQTSSVPTTAEAPHSRADGLGALVRKSR